MNANVSGTVSDKNSQQNKQQVKFDSRTLQEIDDIIMSGGGEDPAFSRKAAAGDQPDAEKVASVSNTSGLAGPIGIDIGTTSIVVAANNCSEAVSQRQLNCFYVMDHSKMVADALLKDGAGLFCKNGKIYVFGTKAQDLSVLYGEALRKPVEGGIMNNREDDCLDVIKAIIASLVGKSVKQGETVCFNMPGESIDGIRSTVFHESVITAQLREFGYLPKIINEGLAVVYSELADNNFTGIGISIGGGMTNVCLSYLAVPVITYSFNGGGDYLDAMAADAVGESVFTIRDFKEGALDLSREPGSKTETALHVFYEALFMKLAKSLEKVLSSSDRLPRINKALPLVLSGGSVMPGGSKKKFEQALKQVKLPVKLSQIMLARDPLASTALGSLKMAAEEPV